MPQPKTLSSEELFAKVQLGIRMNKRLVKVLKATAEYMDMPFAMLIESMAVTALQGDCVFGPDVLKQVERFKEIYGLDEMLEALGNAADEFDEYAKEATPERPRKK
jgi:hypothetical protein